MAVADALAYKDWDRAAEVLDRQRISNPDDKLKVSLWRAHLLARTGKLADAARQYASSAADAAKLQYYSAELFAKMCQIVMLYQDKQYKEMLDLCRAVTTRFPQVSPERYDEPLKQYMEDARKRLAASQPSVPASPKAADPKENSK
jgi:hypothetical protein